MASKKEDYQISDQDIFDYVCENYLVPLRKQCKDVELEPYRLEEDQGFTVCGREQNIHKALKSVQNVVKNIKVDYTQLNDAQNLDTTEGKKYVKGLEHKHKVNVNLMDMEEEAQVDPRPKETVPAFLWTFPSGPQLMMKCCKAVDSGAAVVAQPFQTMTTKSVWNKDMNSEHKCGVTLVQFPIPSFKTTGHMKLLKQITEKLFEQFHTESQSSFAIDVGVLKEWPLEKFTTAVISSFLNYMFSGKSTSEFKLILSVLDKDSVRKLCKSCSNFLMDQNVNHFEFIQINEVIEESKTDNLSIEIIPGDICKVQVDVIVNTTSYNLDLTKGRASKAMLKAAGQKLQKELDRRYTDGLGEGEIAVTGGYKLPCTYVLHGYLDKYDEKTCDMYESDEEFYRTSVHEFMRNCFVEAAEQNCASISFPVIGTGKLLYPAYLVADQMIETIDQLGPDFPVLQTVKIVIYGDDSDILQMFNEHKRKYDKSHTKVTKKMPQRKVLKITGPGEKIKLVKTDILGVLQKEEGSNIDVNKTEFQQSFKHNPGQKLTKDQENELFGKTGNIKGGTFTGKSASRSLSRLNTSRKHPSDKSLHSSTSSTSSSVGLNPQAEDADGDHSPKVFEASRGCEETRDRKQDKQSIGSRNRGSYCNTESERNRSSTSRRNSDEPLQSPDIRCTVTEQGRKASITVKEGQSDRNVILHTTKENYVLVEYFMSDVMEKYKQKRCLITYDDDDEAIILHGDLGKNGCDIKLVKLDITNAVKKVKELQTETVDVHNFNDQAVKKHAGEISTNDVVCMVDKDFTQVTVYSDKYEKVQTTVHQLKVRLGAIRETDRGNRKFLSTTEKDDKLGREIRDDRDNGSTPRSGSDNLGARPKTIQRHMSDVAEFRPSENMKVSVYLGNILHLSVDCIVNAANKDLQHGGGIARAISNAAGRALDKEGWEFVRQKGVLNVGEVKTTTAGTMRYTCVIHAVGPNWHDYKPHSLKQVQKCEEDVYKAVYNSIKEAEKLGQRSVAIPGISAGIYACPWDLCFVQYARAVMAYSKQAPSSKMVKEVHFVDMNRDLVTHMQQIFQAMIPNNADKPKFYDSNLFVEQRKDQKYIKGDNPGYPDKPDHTSWKGNTRPPVDRANRQDQRKHQAGHQSDTTSTYPYCSRKILPGYTYEEFVCVVSPKLSLYVYNLGLTDSISGFNDMIACGELKNGNSQSSVNKFIEAQFGSKFCEAKKKKFLSAKVGDVVVVPTPGTGAIKAVAHLVLYQKKETKSEEDRKQKMKEMYKKLFTEVKKMKCKSLALALPGTGKGGLKVNYGTERLCEGLTLFAFENSDYELSIHLINQDKKKTANSIDTIKSLVDSFRSQNKPQRPKDPPKTSKEQGNNRNQAPYNGPSNPGSKPPTRPQSASYVGQDKPQLSGGSRSMYGRPMEDKIKTQEFHRSASPQGNTGNQYSDEEESDDSEDDCDDEYESEREDEEDENCVICMGPPRKPRKLVCGHTFCQDCIDQAFIYKEACPVCGKVCGTITGNQPDGDMKVTKNKHKSCAGYEQMGRIEIDYYFPDGRQGDDHPDPGKLYKGIRRVAYLPDNKDGRQIRDMLKVAFDRKLVFTIGSSRTTGQEGVITWNDIHHKTDPKPHSQFGYPDPSYLDRVKDELAAKGVTEADV